MQPTDFDSGHQGVFMFMGTVILYVINAETMHALAGLATILAGVSTALWNLKKFFSKTKK